VVVVGASVAGVHLAQQLRAQGCREPITLVTDETDLPYDRPPLSKQFLLGRWSPEHFRLVDTAALAALDVVLLPGDAAVGVDVAHRLVETASGRQLPYRVLVLATGAGARRLPGVSTELVHVLRSLDDARSLRRALEDGRSLAVVGGGLVGTEVAAAARELQVEVTLLAEQEPLSHVFGQELGQVCRRLHEAHGVDVRVGSRVERVVEAERGRRRLVLQSGADVSADVSADVVLVAVGAQPGTGWLEGSGIPCDDGVPCGQDGRVEGLEDVYAVGDVAAWPDAQGPGSHRRVEHWTSAREQARLVATALVGGSPGPLPPHYLWSDQFGLKLQLLGHVPCGGSQELVHGSLEDGRFVLLHFDSDDQMAAAVAFGRPRQLARYRPLLAARAPRTQVLHTAAQLDAAG
jgi:NADPH-dependent 2,4-dienoyl-CoA reductase/sulfur reductase-like enzyme